MRRRRNRIDMMQFRIQHRVDFILLHTIKMKNNRYSEWKEEGVKRSPTHTIQKVRCQTRSAVTSHKILQMHCLSIVVRTLARTAFHARRAVTRVVFTIWVIHILNDKLLCGSRTLMRPWINIENWWLMYTYSVGLPVCNA